ncbi:MAG: ABC transporter substrate-binding protein [Acetobacteraceae bacterium]|nr:ABC transporter substrate-binding protein [Acetobacteraceae bacterium]
MKRALAVAAVLLLFGTTLAGCARGGQPQAVRPLVYAFHLEAKTLDPHVDDFGYDRVVQSGVYEPLMDYQPKPDGQWDLAPALAKKWEVSSDARVYTLYLQEGVKFSDGTPFNAAAVKWNFERLLALNKPPADTFRGVKFTIEEVNQYTVRFVLETPRAPFLYDLAWPLMVSPSVMKFEKNGDRAQEWLQSNALGTGPYLLKEWVKGSHITLVRNPEYWRGWKGKHLNEIVLQFIPDAQTRVLMLQKGDADLAAQIKTAPMLDSLRASEGVVVEEVPGCTMQSFIFKLRGPLQDSRVRRALALAFDYEGFCDKVLKGLGRPATGPFAGVEFGFDSRLPRFKQDLAASRALLAEAGYAGGLPSELQLQIISAFIPQQKDAAQILQSNLAGLGIKLKINDVADVSTYFRSAFDPDLNVGPDMYAWAYATRTGDPDRTMRQFTEDEIPPKGNNGGFYRNARAKELINQAISESNLAKRKQLYYELQKVLIDDPPAMYLAVFNDYICRRAEVKGFDFILAGARGPRWYYMYLEK